MKILYIHQYFQLPKNYGTTRSYWITKELIKNGHQVTMLTTNDKIESKIKRETTDGIDIIYLKVPYNQKMGFFNRLNSFISFMLKSTLVALKEKDFDLVIATSTPLTIGFPALVVKKLKKIPYVFEVRDLWPEVPIQMGGLKNPFLIKLALWFEKAIYKNASHIIALSPGMSEGVIKRNIPESKVTMIPNMSKIDAYWAREKDKKLMKKFNLKEDSFKVVYFGSMGLANGMDYIIDAIGYLNEVNQNSNIEFIFMGGGAMKPSLMERCKNEGINNAFFLGGFPLKQLSNIVNLCDVSLVTFSNIPILATNSPNKLFDSLSAGKAIIVNSPGWTKKLVEKYNCGIFVDPENPKELGKQILFLKENPEICKEMGRNGRVLAETKYDISILCKEFVDVIDTLNIPANTKTKR